MKGSVLALDPSLASTGWAFFIGGPRPPDAGAALRRFDRCGMIQTDSDDSLQERLAEIHEAIRHLIHENGPEIVAIEMPATFYSYGRHGGRAAQAHVVEYFMAVGAILASARLHTGPGDVLQVKAPSGRFSKKEYRHEYLEAKAGQVGMDWPVGPRGGKLPDVYDAIWVGVQVLRTPPMAAEG